MRSIPNPELRRRVFFPRTGQHPAPERDTKGYEKEKTGRCLQIGEHPHAEGRDGCNSGRGCNKIALNLSQAKQVIIVHVT